MTSPIEMIAGLVVGTVEAVAPDDIRVRLGPEAPLSTAFNAGRNERLTGRRSRMTGRATFLRKKSSYGIPG